MTNPFGGLGAIFYKEVRHMRRDPMAISVCSGNSSRADDHLRCGD